MAEQSRGRRMNPLLAQPTMNKRSGLGQSRRVRDCVAAGMAVTPRALPRTLTPAVSGSCCGPRMAGPGSEVVSIRTFWLGWRDHVPTLDEILTALVGKGFLDETAARASRYIPALRPGGRAGWSIVHPQRGEIASFELIPRYSDGVGVACETAIIGTAHALSRAVRLLSPVQLRRPLLPFPSRPELSSKSRPPRRLPRPPPGASSKPRLPRLIP